MFHFQQENERDVRKAVLQTLKGIELPKRRRGRPRNEEKDYVQEQIRQDRRSISQNRQIFGMRAEKLTQEQHNLRNYLISKSPLLGAVVNLMYKVYNMLDSSSFEEAQHRRMEILQGPSYESPHLQNILHRIQDEQYFHELFTYLRLGFPERTNNHVERRNRWFRKMQKNCYKLRSAGMIDNRIKIKVIQEMEQRMLDQQKEMSVVNMKVAQAAV